MRKLVLALSAASLAVPAALPAPAMAQERKPHGEVRHGPDAPSSCRGPNGTADPILGGGGGGPLDRHGERKAGTSLGAALGALLGDRVERKVVSRCR
jgi:hypothetical protein